MIVGDQPEARNILCSVAWGNCGFDVIKSIGGRAAVVWPGVFKAAISALSMLKEALNI